MIKFKLGTVSLFIAFVWLGCSSHLMAQSDRLKLIFTENRAPLTVGNLRVEAVSPKTGKVLKILDLFGQEVLIPIKFTDLKNFDLRMSFDGHQLLLPNLNADYFDNEWTIDVGDPISKNAHNKFDKLKCPKVKRVYRIDFHPTDGEGFWWLLSGCSS